MTSAFRNGWIASAAVAIALCGAPAYAQSTEGEIVVTAARTGETRLLDTPIAITAMNAEQLSKVGSDLVRRCGTRDPFQIANALGINVMDDCENLGSLKGMYCIVKRNRFIFLNKDLSPQMKRIVCAHEIGHDRLHRALAKKHGLQEFVLYDMATKPEYEANIVAAEILLDSDEILEYIYDYGYTSEQIARAMHTDINLVALKIAHLAETGHKLRRMEYRSSFLK